MAPSPSRLSPKKVDAFSLLKQRRGMAHELPHLSLGPLIPRRRPTKKVDGFRRLIRRHELAKPSGGQCRGFPPCLGVEVQRRSLKKMADSVGSNDGEVEMLISVESRDDAEPVRERWKLPAGLANRPDPDWQGPTLRIRHQGAEWRQCGRARVSTTKVGDR